MESSASQSLFYLSERVSLFGVYINKKNFNATTSLRFSGWQGMVSQTNDFLKEMGHESWQLSSHFHVNSRVVGDLETHGSLTTSLDQGGANDR
jgi:hypothetical protein